MSTLATCAALGILALAATAGCCVALTRGREQVDRLTPRGYEPAPDSEPTAGIRVNPGREPW